jgi:hypothetical protein
MTIRQLQIIARVLPFLLLSGAAYAQTQSAPPPSSVAPAPLPAAVPKQQLDQMLAPIALYPDELVTNILMAATYPADVGQAAIWLKDPNNAALKGDALADALRPQPWDPSVKFLMPFPQVVQQLNDRADWRQQIGDAFTVQQAEMMTEVQHLRQLAVSCGKLQSTPQQVVTRRHSTIVIAPADPRVVYLPVYNPTVVYGVWPYQAYQPRYFPAPSGFAVGGIGFGLDVGIGYSAGYSRVGSYWGWNRPDWQRGQVDVNYAQARQFNSFESESLSRRYAGGRWNSEAQLAREGRGVGFGASAQAFMRGDRGYYGHHDNGLHLGHYKQHDGEHDNGNHGEGHEHDGEHDNGNHGEGHGHGGGKHGGEHGDHGHGGGKDD